MNLEHWAERYMSKHFSEKPQPARPQPRPCDCTLPRHKRNNEWLRVKSEIVGRVLDARGRPVDTVTRDVCQACGRVIKEYRTFAHLDKLHPNALYKGHYSREMFGEPGGYTAYPVEVGGDDLEGRVNHDTRI